MPFHMPALLLLVIGSLGCGIEGLTEEEFMQAMRKQQPYWMLKRSYNDTVSDGKTKVCIETTEATSNIASAGTTSKYTFLRKYRLGGCDWFPFTHDARYSVTFSNDSGAGAGLSMTMEPITAGTGTSATYQFQYWNTTENCFVLTSTGSENEKQCELNAWNSTAIEEADFPGCQTAYQKHCPTPEQPYKVFTANCRVTLQNFDPTSTADVSTC
nr:uncharacterized protein LOC129385431 [Dermacentor andersoni]